jgi:hypothetical protein
MPLQISIRRDEVEVPVDQGLVHVGCQYLVAWCGENNR